MTPQHLTVKQLENACNIYPFLVLRLYNGKIMAINSKAAIIAKRRGNYKANDNTDFISFAPCDFQTYISHKAPFLT